MPVNLQSLISNLVSAMTKRLILGLTGASGVIYGIRALEMLRGTKSSQVAHYYCELAEAARAAGDHAAARDHLRHTVRSESGAIRGTLIRATLAREENDYALHERRLCARSRGRQRWRPDTPHPTLVACGLVRRPLRDSPRISASERRSVSCSPAFA